MMPPAAPQASTTALTDDERLAWLRLIRSDNVGTVTFRDLLAHFGSASAALDALPDMAARGGRGIRICRVEDAERELAAAAKIGAGSSPVSSPLIPPGFVRSMQHRP